jgi:hypothetical protein
MLSELVFVVPVAPCRHYSPLSSLAAASPARVDPSVNIVLSPPLSLLD